MNQKTQVIMPDFEIHTTPLEKILIDAYSVEILLDDIRENRYRIFAKPYQAIKIITIDCASSENYHNDYCFRDGKYHRHILLMINSNLINELKINATEHDFLEKAKHFILPLQENIVEIIAYELVVEKVD